MFSNSIRGIVVERWHSPYEAEAEFFKLILICFPTIYCSYFILTEFSYFNTCKRKGKAIPVLQTHRPGQSTRIPGAEAP
jgi:hypothetical protein